MRPKLLEIEGLQSFQDKQVIDFQNLDETGLFGIFGPTGSGKSTVLDAITFALYGKVKRAERGTQGIINSNMDNVQVSFTFELLRDNYRKVYRVDRNYRRKKGSENSSEPKVVRLIEVTDAGEIPICDKATEVSNSVEALLGLNHSDFTRAVVLPQNSFHEFLMLDNSGKRDMLERIFYLESYGKELTEKVNRKISALKSCVDIISGEMRGYADATDEALETYKAEMEEAIASRKQVEDEFKILDKKYKESSELWANVQELRFLKEKREEQEEKKKSIDEKKSILEKAGKADSLIEKIKKIKELEGLLRDTEEKLNKVLLKLPVVKQNLDNAKHKYEEIKTKSAAEQPGLVALKTRLYDALKMRDAVSDIEAKIKESTRTAKSIEKEINTEKDKIKEEKGLLEELSISINNFQEETSKIKVDPEYRQQIQDGVTLEKELTTIEEKSGELNKKLSELNTKIEILNQKKKQAIDEITSYEKAIDNLAKQQQVHEAAVPASRKTLLEGKDKIHLLTATVNILKIKKTEVESVNSAILAIEKKLSGASEKIKELSIIKEERKVFLDNKKAEEEKAVKELEKNTAYMLSKKLVEGDPCPVCGSTHHPEPASINMDSDVSDINKKVNQAKLLRIEAEEAYHKAEKEYLIAAEQEKSLLSQKNQLANERELKLIDYDKEKQKLPEEYHEMELQSLLQTLEKENEGYSEGLEQIDSWEKKKEEYLVENQRLKDALAKERLKENGYSTELDMNSETLLQLTESLDSINNDKSIKKQQYTEFINKHKIDSAALELKKISGYDQKSILIQKQIEQNQKLSTEKRILIDKLNERTQTLNKQQIKIQAEIENLNSQASENEIKIKTLVGDALIEDEIKRVDNILSTYASLETQYNQEYTSLEKQYNNLLSENSVLSSQEVFYKDAYCQEKNNLNDLLTEKGFKDPEEVESSYLPKDKQEELRDEVNGFEKTQLNIRAKIEIVEKKINSRTITEEEWNVIDKSYKEMTSYKEDCVTKSEIAKSEYNQIKLKNEKWTEINKEYSEVINKYDLFMQIQKILKADKSKDNSFIDYIAEERLRYVAAKASELLGTMTGYKYALELDTDSGFVIRDNSNGGVYRMVTSLSGGETFLTSLSLALALSEQIQLKGQSPLEFFFLDEGFGTLDKSLLDTVIDSLEKLSSQERVIGIISHVPELKNRIARRLIVIPPASQTEGSKVKIEKA